MGDIINLRIARKAKGRVAREAEAAANRAAFGRTKAERTVQTEERARADALLDGAKRD